MMDRRPIGMFDSGFGGLTVARAVIDLLPEEDLVYLGDTARYPYGARPIDQVREFSLEIGQYLVDKFDIKVLVVACNTATAAALESLREVLQIPVIGVIEPGVRSVLAATDSGHVGVIGTVATMNSGAYQTAMLHADPLIELTTCACPGFVEFVERGTTEGPQVEVLAERLLTPILDANVDTLLLGCTHYPFLARTIRQVVGPSVLLISSAEETAFALANDLARSVLAHPEPDRIGAHQFISSGDVRAFAAVGSRLLGPELVNAERWKPHAT